MNNLQIIFHIGAHCTAQDRLIRSLLRNRDILSRQGVAVPGPGKYRSLINDAVGILKGAPANSEGQDVLIEAMVDSEDTTRIVLSGENFICTPGNVLEYGTLYPRMGKSAWLRNAFPQASVEFAFTLRNMATFLPALYSGLGDAAPDPEDFLSQTDPRTLRWHGVVEAISDANPGVPILVWCDEDAPFLWPELMREMCDLDALVPLKGDNDLARHLLSTEGNRHLAAALGNTADCSEADRRRIVAEALTEFADETETIQEIELPGWTDALVEELTEIYDRDVERVRAIPGVTLLEP